MKSHSNWTQEQKLTLHPEQVLPTTRKLKAWNGSVVDPIGEATLSVVNPKNQKKHNCNFLVVPNQFTNLFGLPTLRKMNLLSINDSEFHVSALKDEDVTKNYPAVFDHQIGTLPGNVKLVLKETATPRILPVRRIPFALQDAVRTELDRLCMIGVISPIETPTEWVSQMAVARKKNGKIRICIDPSSLTKVSCGNTILFPQLMIS